MRYGITASGLVGIGGAAGSLARYGLSLLAQGFSIEWPFGTFAANALGCLVIGAVAELSAKGEVLSPEARLFLATGFCGGFTTLSSMVYETMQMLKSNEYFDASLYVGLTLIASMMAFLLGSVAVRVTVKAAGGLWN